MMQYPSVSILILAMLVVPRSHPQAMMPPRSPQGVPVSANCRVAINKATLSLTHTIPGELRSLDGFGTIVWLEGGPFQIHLHPCDSSGRIIDAGWFWYHQKQPLNLYLSTGSVRHASLSAIGTKARLCATGPNGATYCDTLPRVPAGFGVLYFDSRPSVIFDNGRNGYGTAIYIKDNGLHLFDMTKRRTTPPP
jgi:hypothetical protein